MIKKAKYFYIFFLIVYFQNCFSQNFDLRFDHFSADEGLSDFFTECICADSYGYIWVGARNGLNRFDGYNFKLYQNVKNDSMSISGFYIYSILEDSKRRLWIGSHFGGLSLYNREMDNFMRIKISDSHKWSEIVVRDIVEIEEDIFAIATQFGLCIYNHKTKSYKWENQDLTNSSNHKTNDLKCLFVDNKKNIWIGGEDYGGLSKCEYISFNEEIEIKKIESRQTENIRDIYAINDSILWYGIQTGIKEFNVNTSKSHLLKFPELSYQQTNLIVYSIKKYGNKIWIGTENAGLIIHDLVSKQTKQYLPSKDNKTGINSISISDSYIDKQNNIWISTHGAGIAVLNKRKNLFLNYANNGTTNCINNNSVSCFYEDDNSCLWIGTDGGGLNYFNRESETFNQYIIKNKIVCNAILDIIKSEDNKLYISSWEGGITKFDPVSKTYISIKDFVLNKEDIRNDNVKGILLDDDNLLISTHFDGIYILNLNTKEIHTRNNIKKQNKFFFLSHGNNIIKDNYGDYWNATSQGLFWINHDTVVTFIYDENIPNSISDSYISTIYEDSKKQLWIATGKGLDIFNRKDSSFINMNEQFGIDSKICSVIEDKNGNLWMSSGKGIYKINPNNNESILFTKEDGLPGNQFIERAALKTKKGELIFGGIDGFTIFLPDSINKSIFKPDIYITDFKLFNISQNYRNKNSVLKQDISSTRSISLTYNQNNISFDYVAIDYNAPKKIQYAYILEGFDDNWVYVKEKRNALYTNLDPGNYTFKVQSTNSDGVWTNNYTEIQIEISPPYWHTWWFRTIIFLLLFLIIYFIFYLRSMRIRNANKKLKNEVIKRTKKLQEAYDDVIEKNEEIKNINEKLNHYNEQIIKQADHILSQQNEIILKKQELEESNKLKDRLFSIIGHDLKGPLGNIMGFSELLSSRIDVYDKEKISKMVEAINTSSNSMYSLLINLLTWAKNQSNQIGFNPKQFIISEIINDNVKLYEQQFDNKKIKLNYFIDKDTSAFGDYEMIDTIVRNILNNAIKFTPENGEITIEVSETDNKVAVSIIDSGIGMTEDQINKLFDQNTYHSTIGTNNEKGTGFGFKICLDFASRNNAEITINSVINKGSTFTLWLNSNSWYDAEEIILPQTQISNNIKDLNKFSKQDFSNLLKEKKILIVEDIPELRFELKEYLHEDLIIFEAENGFDALTLAKDFHPDLILSDINMPVMDGLSMCKNLKSTIETCHIPVFLLTGEEDINIHLMSFNAGAISFFKKPYNKQQIQSSIYEYFILQNELKTNYLNSDLLIPVEMHDKDIKFFETLIHFITIENSSSKDCLDSIIGETNFSSELIREKIFFYTGLIFADFFDLIKLKLNKEN